ncbi:TonB-dependent receptor plug domain-containing protein [Flavobacterium sp. JP2137]|uniref:TonB-dependent receptor plug domain-containing protein n=1 Tax=Flavobacterium sp. JP2137 TaxID=3414510 RepID=UPI003D2FF7F2
MKYKIEVAAIKIVIGCLVLGLSATGTWAQEKKDSLSIARQAQLLQEVIIEKKNENREIMETPLPITLLDLKPVLGQSGNLTQALRRIPGVNIRTDGGIGDPVKFNLSGLGGKAIVLFKDGIPMSFYGHSFEPSHVPTNMFDRIEVYKGVLPLSLGADALGGGINFVTKQYRRKAIEAAFEASSFNTQRMSLSFYLPDTVRNWYAGANIGYTASDNNWEVDIGRPLPPNTTALDFDNYAGGYIFDRTEVHRIKNNAVNAYTGEYYIGIKDKSWADDLRLTLINSWYYRRMNRIPDLTPMVGTTYSVFAFAEDKTISTLLSYKKKLFDERLNLNLIGGHSYTNAVFKDTSSYSVDRLGVIVGNKSPLVGEITVDGADMNLNYNFYTLRGYANYDVLPNHQVQLNYIFSDSNRIGTDTLGGMVFSNQLGDLGKKIDRFEYRSIHQKQIAALGISSKFFDGKLENLLAGKYYDRKAKGYSTFSGLGSSRKETDQTTHWGWMEAISYHPTDRWLFKASYEFATRLPDDFEVFGDSKGVKSSFGLQPERSRNANLQLQYNSANSGRGFWMVGGNLFYRKTSDLIVLIPDIPFSYHTNAPTGVEVKGIELDFYYQPFRFFSFGGNATYMDRFFYDNHLDERVRAWDKSPILANLQARLFQFDWFQKGSKFELYWYWSYTHRYGAFPFIVTETGMFEKLDKEVDTVEMWVPFSGRIGQAVHTLGLIYEWAKPKASIAVESYNLTDNAIYDNFLNQGPGRTFSVKLRWQLD